MKGKSIWTEGEIYVNEGQLFLELSEKEQTELSEYWDEKACSSIGFQMVKSNKTGHGSDPLAF